MKVTIRTNVKTTQAVRLDLTDTHADISIGAVANPYITWFARDGEEVREIAAQLIQESYRIDAEIADMLAGESA